MHAATIQKMVKELMPADMRVGGDAIDILCACCSEFVQLLASEANEIATKEKKSTITPEFILKAIRDLGFTDFLEEVTATMEQHKEESKGEVTAQRENFLGHDSTILPLLSFKLTPQGDEEDGCRQGGSVGRRADQDSTGDVRGSKIEIDGISGSSSDSFHELCC